MTRKNFISMRFADEEKEKIRARAKAVGIPIASYCKYLILSLLNKKEVEENAITNN